MSCPAAHSCADASPGEGVTRPVPAVSAAGDALTTRRAARALTGVRLAPPGFGPPPSCFWLSGAPGASGTDARPCRVIGFPYCPGVRTWVSEDQTALARRCCGSCEDSLGAIAEQRGSLVIWMGRWGGGGWRRAVRPVQRGVKPHRSRAPHGLLRYLCDRSGQQCMGATAVWAWRGLRIRDGDTVTRRCHCAFVVTEGVTGSHNT